MALVRFDHAGSGLMLKPSDTDNFEIAGQDVFRPASFRVTDEGLHLWSHQVSTPVAVRYGLKTIIKEIFSIRKDCRRLLLRCESSKQIVRVF